jgi:hypothetical protein
LLYFYATFYRNISRLSFFGQPLIRSVSEGLYNWKWDLRKDRAEFMKYYNLFISDKNPPPETPSLKKAYEEFRKTFGDRILLLG